MRRSRPAILGQSAFTRLAAVFAMFALALTALIGTWAALLFILAALSLIAMDPADAARTTLRFSPLLLIPLLAMISTIWSDAPQRTLRAGIQLLLTMIAALLMARKLEPRQAVLTLFFSFVAVSATALPFVPRDILRGVPLSGLFESKNQLGTSLQLAFALGLAVGLDRDQPRGARLFALLAVPSSIPLLWLTQSATAQTSAGITLLVFPLLLLFGRIPISGRVALAMVLVAVAAVALVFLPVIVDAIGDFRQNVLKKDATLTGRTYLWEFAARLTAERPLLGHGYYAFWRQGNLDAEGLWRWAGITQRDGFNFHNAFVEMKVDLGYIGQALLICSCVVSFAATLFRQLVQPSVPVAFFLALQIVLYARSISETGLIAPFSLLTVLWVTAAFYAFFRDGANERPAAASRIARQRSRSERRTARRI